MIVPGETNEEAVELAEIFIRQIEIRVKANAKVRCKSMGVEQNRLREISKVYHSEQLGGVNETYHLYLRDQLIPAEGGTSALELGCGNGSWSRVLCQRYAELDIVDGSEDLLAFVKEECAGGQAVIRTHAQLVEEFLEQVTRGWQDIYMTFLLEHLVDPITCLRAACRLLEENGRMFLAVPNADSVHRILAVRAGIIQHQTNLSDSDKLVDHRRIYTRALLHEHIETAGLRITAEKAIGLKPLTLNQLSPLPENVVDALCLSGDLAPANAAYLAVICEAA